MPFVFGGRDQITHQYREQIIIDHRAIIVTVQAAAAFFEDGAPEKNRAGKRNQPEERAQKIVPAVNKRILQPDIEDRDVLLNPAPAHARNRNRKGSAKNAKWH